MCHFSAFAVFSAAAASRIAIVDVFISRVVLRHAGLLTCPFEQFCSPPRTKPPGRNSYVDPEFRVLVHTVSGPYSHVPSAFRDKPAPSAPIPGAHATSPPISGLYFRASLYSHRFFCTLQCSKLLTIRVSLEREISLPLSPCYMPCIRP